MRVSRLRSAAVLLAFLTTTAWANPPFKRKAEQSIVSTTAEATAERAWRVVTPTVVHRTGESLAPKAGTIAAGVGIGAIVAILFGWHDARKAPKEQKSDAFFDAFILGVPGPTPTYRDTFPAVRDGLISAVKNAPKDDPIHDSWLGQAVEGPPPAPARNKGPAWVTIVK